MYITYTITAFYFTDIMLNFNTSYYEMGFLVTNRLKIALNYMKLWFWLDLGSTLPLEAIFEYFEYANNTANSPNASNFIILENEQPNNDLMKIFRLLKFIRLLRYYYMVILLLEFHYMVIRLLLDCY